MQRTYIKSYKQLIDQVPLGSAMSYEFCINPFFIACIFELTKENAVKAVTDCHPRLEELCELLEVIFRKGLVLTHSSPFGLTKKDYWSWIQSTISGSDV